MPHAMYYVGYCRVCSTGPLGLWRCGACEAVVVLCDECDSVWRDAEDLGSPPVTACDELTCPHCGSRLLGAPSHWATLAEVHESGWAARALAAGAITLSRGAPFTPHTNLGDAGGGADTP